MTRAGFYHALTRSIALLLLLASLLGPAVSSSAQAIQAEEATETDGAQFQNERARAHMLELESRMFRLAELIRETQPEDAQRLEMAINRSREELVVQRMASVSELIAGLELSQASTKLDEVISELQEIKKLLLTADLDVAIKLEQLRKINAAIKEIEKIEKQEAENQGQSDKLAQDGKPSEAAMKGLGEAEDRNQEATDQLTDKVGDINPQDGDLKKAQESLGQASKSMGQASKSLSESQSPSGASQSQSDARKKLDEAKKALEDAKKKLQDEIEKKIREQVMDNLRAMLKQETQIREQLELVSERADQGDARAIVQVRSFAAPQLEIITLAQDTIELCEMTEFSVAMPAALGAVRERMVYLADDYTAGLGGPNVVASTVRVEEDLKALIEAMEQSNQNQPPKDGKPQEPREQEKREMNQILAELKMLRIMQVATNENVARQDQAKTTGDQAQAELRRREEMVRDQQERVRQAMEKLREKAMQQGG